MSTRTECRRPQTSGLLEQFALYAIAMALNDTGKGLGSPSVMEKVNLTPLLLDPLVALIDPLILDPLIAGGIGNPDFILQKYYLLRNSRDP